MYICVEKGVDVTRQNHKDTLIDLLESHGGPGFEQAVAEKVCHCTQGVYRGRPDRQTGQRHRAGAG